MLRKRNKSYHKNQHMDLLMDSSFRSNISNHQQRNTTFLKVFNPKNSDSDSAGSSTSPLDFRLYSRFRNLFRRPRVSPCERPQKSWDCSKVGLSIVDSLDEKAEQLETGNVIGSFDRKNILVGRKMSNKSLNPQSFLETATSISGNIPVYPCTQVEQAKLEKGNPDLVFEIAEAPVEPESYENSNGCSFVCQQQELNLIDPGPQREKGSIPSESSGSVGKLSSIPPANEIELSEDYTCVTTHGPNPKVIHIFGDHILECRSSLTNSLSKTEGNSTTPEEGEMDRILALCPSNKFLKFCDSCQKKLDGEDIYIYRGEKAFCSYSCRLQEIEVKEEMEKSYISNSCEIFNKSNSWEAI